MESLQRHNNDHSQNGGGGVTGSDGDAARGATHDDAGVTSATAGRWFYISDARVSEATESRALQCQAYLLFYERVV